MKKLLLFVALSATAIGVQAKQPVDNLGAQAISAADFSTAETRLTAQLRREPGLPEALLNLAYVYRATGRGGVAFSGDYHRTPEILPLTFGPTEYTKRHAR